MNKKYSILFLLLFAGGFLFGYLGCSKKVEITEREPIRKINDSTLALDNEVLKNISLSRAVITDFPDRLNLMGRISVPEDRLAVVPARVAGRIDAVFLASGETVTKGQILASLFSPDYIAAKEEYLQSLKEEKKTKAIDDSDFENLATMARKKLITMGLSSMDVDALVRNTSKPSNLIVRAPRGGVLIDKKATVGNLANVGDTLFTIADLGKVWFSGDLYPEDLQKVHKDQEIIIETEGEKLVGKVSFISPVVDAVARTIKIRALMDNPKLLLKADLYVQGSLLLSNKKALVIPSQAVIRLQDVYSVFKKIAEDKFQKVAIQILSEQNNVVAISDGLKEGDEVVSTGALLLDAALDTTRR